MKEETINALIYKSLREECSPVEKAQLDQWLQAGEHNRTHYEQIAAIEKSLRTVDFELDPATDTEWEKLRTVIEGEEKAIPAPSPQVIPLRTMLRGRWRIAAAILLLAVLGWLVADRFYPGTEQPQLAQEILVPRGERLEKTLPDGTVVVLNSATTLVISPDYNRSDRRVELSGEAFFRVATNPDKAFLIRTGAVTTRVVGTSFNVSAYPDDTQIEVAVVEGKVQLYDERQEGQLLLANQAGRYDTQTGNIEVRTIDAADELAWQKGELVFRSETLPEVFRTLERHFDVTINAGPLSPENRFTARFDAEDPITKVLDQMALLYSLDIRIEGDMINVSPK